MARIAPKSILFVVCLSTLAMPAVLPRRAEAGDQLQAGVNVHAMWREYDVLDDPARLERVLTRLDNAGVRWIRMDLGWSSIEYRHNDDEHDFHDRTLRRVLGMMDRHGFKVLVSVMCTPAWVFGRTPGAGDNDEIACNLPPPDPGYLADFLNDYVLNRADRDNYIKDRVDAWEIWNEPDLKTGDGFRDGDGFTPGRYAGLVRAAYRVLHPEDERLVAGSSVSQKALMATNGRPVRGNAELWLNNIFDPNGDGHGDDGIRDHFDILSTHPYQGPTDLPPEFPDKDTNGDGRGDNIFLIDHTPVVKALMRFWGDGDKSIWFTEIGWSVHPNTGGEYGNWLCGVTLQQQANYLSRALDYIDRKFRYVGVAFWYNEVDTEHSHARNWYESQQWDNLGLLYDNGGLEPKPAFWALERWIERRRDDRPPEADPRPEQAGGPASPQTHIRISVHGADLVWRDDRCRKQAIFTVLLSQPHESDEVRVRYKTVERSAEGHRYGVPPADYQHTEGLLVFSPGQVSKQVTVPILTVWDCRGNCGYETFVLRLHGANQTIGDGEATGEIH